MIGWVGGEDADPRLESIFVSLSNVSMFRFFWKNKFGKLFLLLAGCAVVFAWNPSFVSFTLRTVIGTVLAPLHNVVGFFGYHTNQTKVFFLSVGQLKHENERLLAETIDLKARVAALSDIARENEILREDRGLLSRDRLDFKAAEVIGRDSVSSGGAILIGAGETSGIRKGMAVVVGNGVLIGRVFEVAPFSSRVLLVSDSESAINAVAGSEEARGIVRGEYGLGLVLDMVIQTDTLREGDEVITSGLGGDVPRGLFIGTATSVESSNDRLFQRATLVSPVRFDRLRFVSVVLDAKL